MAQSSESPPPIPEGPFETEWRETLRHELRDFGKQLREDMRADLRKSADRPLGVDHVLHHMSTQGSLEGAANANFRSPEHHEWTRRHIKRGSIRSMMQETDEPLAEKEEWVFPPSPSSRRPSAQQSEFLHGSLEQLRSIAGMGRKQEQTPVEPFSDKPPQAPRGDGAGSSKWADPPDAPQAPAAVTPEAAGQAPDESLALASTVKTALGTTRGSTAGYRNKSSKVGTQTNVGKGDRAMGMYYSKKTRDHLGAAASGVLTSWPGLLRIRQRVKPLLVKPVFEFLIMFMIFANAVQVGWQTDYMARQLLRLQPTAFRVADVFFCVFFTCELALRIFVHGRRFFHVFGWAWNIFDSVLILLQLSEEVMMAATGYDLQGMPSSMLPRIVRVLRAVRVVRVMRVMQFTQDLQLLVSCIMHSIKSFYWASALLTLMIYVVSIYVTQVVLVHRLDSELLDDGGAGTGCCSELVQWFGNVPIAVVSLFQALTGGVDWNDILRPLMFQVSPWLGVFGMIYMMFAVLAVMNVVTGTFVQTAIERAGEVKDIGRVHHARRLFKSLDLDQSGFISLNEIDAHLETDLVKEWFEAIDVDPSEAKCLFELLDINNSGSIDFEEFLGGCLRLQGPAKAVDLLLVTRDNRVSFERQSECLYALNVQVQHLRELLSKASVADAPQRQDGEPAPGTPSADRPRGGEARSP